MVLMFVVRAPVWADHTDRSDSGDQRIIHGGARRESADRDFAARRATSCLDHALTSFISGLRRIGSCCVIGGHSSRSMRDYLECKRNFTGS